jgi:hypothetical protein
MKLNEPQAIDLNDVPTLGEVADFGNEICQPCTNFELKTKININRETRHFAKRVLVAVFLTNF